MIRVSRDLLIAPSEIERVLLSHPSVADAAAVGVKAVHEANSQANGNTEVHGTKDRSEIVLEVPRAFLVLKKASASATVDAEAAPAGAVLADELTALVRERLTDSLQLRGGVTFLEAIPRLPSGKIQREQLKTIPYKPGSE
jgi:4-coumarate--CoA ligase